jgi:succinate dehydrogenase/fumarate reductase flavoprotein subunit
MSDVTIKDSYDVVVMGAGAGGMTAAAVAASRGLSAIVIEKTGLVGGTTAISGGMVWAPGSGKQAASTGQDSPQQAAAYLDAVVRSQDGRDVRRHYLAEAPKAIAYLEQHTHVHLAPVPFYPDYYPDAPGATLSGRVLEPLAFDARQLGAAFARLRPPLPAFTLFGGMMVARADIPHFRNVFKSARSLERVLRLVAAYCLQRTRFHRGTHLVLGNALAARLLKSLLDLEVPILFDTSTLRLLRKEGRVCGVEVQLPSGEHRLIAARCGVVLACGGFSHGRELRARLLPPEAGECSAAAEGSTGDGLLLGQAVGGVLAEAADSPAFWTPVSLPARGDDGRPSVFPHTVTDRGKPGMLAVNAAGLRFTNEADSYHEFVKAVLRTHPETSAIPAYLICDRRSLWKYGLGAVKPMTLRLKPYRRSGYLVEALNLRTLAARLGIDAGNLEATVATYNRDAAAGIDSKFGRGSNAYHRYVGDAANLPNPCMRPVEKPPFYAVALYPADLGTATGLRTGRNGEVLDREGRAVAGLYACGNDMSSIMGGAYPGPGITLGPALVFGYLAATHIAEVRERDGVPSALPSSR